MFDVAVAGLYERGVVIYVLGDTGSLDGDLWTLGGGIGGSRELAGVGLLSAFGEGASSDNDGLAV